MLCLRCHPSSSLRWETWSWNRPLTTLTRHWKNSSLTALSEQRRLQQLFTEEELGDRKPTQLLRRMQQLLGDRPGLDTSFLRELFLQRLPQSIRIVLASTPDGTALDKLAEMADKIMEVATPSISAMNTPSWCGTTPLPSSATDMEQLRSDMQRLEKLVRQLSRTRSSSQSSRHSSRHSPTPTTETDATDSSDSLCWYHRKFGDRARSCHQPWHATALTIASCWLSTCPSVISGTSLKAGTFMC